MLQIITADRTNGIALQLVTGWVIGEADKPKPGCRLPDNIR
jgi:hypothetical protein